MGQAENWDVVDDYSVEIWFPIAKDADGYPESKSWEQLLANPVLERDDYFRLDSIPFFLKSVCRGDIVRADIGENREIQVGQIFLFREVIDRGNHNTYRLLLRRKDKKDPEFTIDELLRKGLSVEEQNGDFLAVDVPCTVDQASIDDYLRAQRRSERWELQDGFLNKDTLSHREKTSV